MTLAHDERVRLIALRDAATPHLTQHDGALPAAIRCEYGAMRKSVTDWACAAVEAVNAALDAPEVKPFDPDTDHCFYCNTAGDSVNCPVHGTESVPAPSASAVDAAYAAVGRAYAEWQRTGKAIGWQIHLSSVEDHDAHVAAKKALDAAVAALEGLKR